VRQAHLVGKIITGGDQQRTALLHIARDVFVLEELQDVPMLVMIKDDEIEEADLVRKQLTGRKSDQRELV
jgi:glycerate-2-kinase